MLSWGFVFDYHFTYSNNFDTTSNRFVYVRADRRSWISPVPHQSACACTHECRPRGQSTVSRPYARYMGKVCNAVVGRRVTNLVSLCTECVHSSGESGGGLRGIPPTSVKTPTEKVAVVSRFVRGSANLSYSTREPSEICHGQIYRNTSKLYSPDSAAIPSTKTCTLAECISQQRKRRKRYSASLSTFISKSKHASWFWKKLKWKKMLCFNVSCSKRLCLKQDISSIEPLWLFAWRMWHLELVGIS